ncbi:MAG: lysophospholipid acyltransferase family protein [Cytophagales bacterium]|nr:lysophospholipid acyltransferase family protein [Cytophagales bacterium]
MEEKLKKDQTYIFCSNHPSTFDILILLLLPRPVCFIGAAWVMRVPFMGWQFADIHIPINRDSLLSKYKGMKEAFSYLRQGRDLLVLPEGTTSSRTPTRLLPLKRGAFKIAIETGTPIVPMTLPYNWLATSSADPNIPFEKFQILIHAPIETKGLTTADLPRLKDQVKDVIEAPLIKLFPEKEKAERADAGKK